MTNKPAASLNIVILPDTKVAHIAIGKSKKLGKEFEIEFVLDTTKYRPHITLYQAHFPLHNMDLLKDRLSEIAANTKPFAVNLNSFEILYRTFVFWNCVKTKVMQKLHEKIVSELNPLRKGLIKPDLIGEMENFAGEDRDEIKTYGSLLIGPRYHPHITITRLVNPEDGKQAIESLGKRKQAAFELNNFSLTYLGPHGTVPEIIETYQFG